MGRLAHRRSRTRYVIAVLVAAVAPALFSSAAQAEQRNASLDEQSTGARLFDVQQIRALFDREQQTLTVTFRLYQPLPDDSSRDYESVAIASVAASPGYDGQCTTAYQGGEPDTQVQVQKYNGSYNANVSLGDGQWHLVQPSVSVDRYEISVTVSDPRYKDWNPRCLIADGRSDGVFFDGYAPKPPPPPPPCASGTVPALAVTWPDSPRYGVPATVSFEPDLYVEPYVDADKPVQVSVRSAVAGERLRAPWARSFGSAPDSAAFRLYKGDPPARVTVSWYQHDYMGTHCRFTRTRVVSAIVPSIPRVKLDNYGLDLAFSFLGRGGCAKSAYAPLVLKVQGEGTTRRYTLDRPCGSWKTPRPAGTPAFSVSSGRGDENYPATLSLAVRGNRTATYRYSATAFSLGRRVFQRHLIFRIVHIRSVRVWEGTDAFQNYCINSGQTVWSEHLRLYCTIPGYTDRTVSVSK